MERAKGLNEAIPNREIWMVPTAGVDRGTCTITHGRRAQPPHPRRHPRPGVDGMDDNSRIPGRAPPDPAHPSPANRSVYEFLLTHKLLTSMVAAVLAVLAARVVGAGRLWWRGALFNLTPALAAAFYVSLAFADGMPHAMDLASGFAFEFSCLILFFWLFKRLFRAVPRVSADEADRLLGKTLLLQIALAAPNLAGAGFGIFSEGSRIDYLYTSSLSKYLTYAGLMTSAVQASLVASRITASGRLGWAGTVVVLANFGMSVLAGSKGAVFLWLLAICTLVDNRRARVPGRYIVLAVGAVSVALAISIVVISDFFGITPESFSDLVISRFFLNNDARALAFDLRSDYSSALSLFAESFRSIASLFGSPPSNAPLGVLLYDQRLSIVDGSGANTSLMALIMFYSPAGYTLVPSIFAVIAVTTVATAFDTVSRAYRSYDSRVTVLSLGLISVATFSQDFLAFQVVLPVSVLALAMLWVLDRSHAPKRLSPSPVARPRAERRHSGDRRRRGVATLR